MNMKSFVNSHTEDDAGIVMSKVPEVTIYFWIIKVLCTTVGETASDFLNVNLNLGLTYTSLVMGAILAGVLFFQFILKKYTPGVYWLTVVLVSIFGTLVTDNLSDNLHVPLEYSTVVFTAILAATFAGWYALEGTLSIHSIFTRRREAFYWLAILFTFALGTAAGDLMAESLGLGYFTTGIIILALIATFTIAWRTGLNTIIAFWFIYILTRPLGASLGDFLTQTKEHGGIGLGATTTSLIFAAAIVVTVVYLAMSHKDVMIDPVMEEEEDDANAKNTSWQLVIVMVLLLIFSVAGYSWRHQQLQLEERTTAGTQLAAPETQTSLLGDLSVFKTIAQDLYNAVKKGEVANANRFADDLEFEWDKAEARLKPKNPVTWTKVDDAIDKVLRRIRSNAPSHQDLEAIQTLLSILNNT